MTLINITQWLIHSKISMETCLFLIMSKLDDNLGDNIQISSDAIVLQIEDHIVIPLIGFDTGNIK